MPNTIIPIDISKIDAEVISLEKELAEIQAQLDFRKNLKKYLLNQNGVRNDFTPLFNVDSFAAKVSALRPENTGVSDYILQFLKERGKSESRIIIDGYAHFLNRTSEQVRGNVSNALSRLKISGKIDNEYKGGGSLGNGWYLKN